MKDFPNRTGPSDSDEMLSLLISILPDGIDSFGVTITVDGALVSGLAIDRDQWMEEWLTNVESSGEGGSTLAVAIRRGIEKRGVYFMAGDLPDVDRPSYLHLKDAYVLHGRDYFGPMLYRAKISEISGWSISQFENPQRRR